ncbi:hypothetical protein CKO31_05315 [Thiohalocapsa halophila]|uniref:Uncharacterized protein n=1 Tax=Thiohalocapsa halophila TaxID=69359 RepID=A0ABS1CE62_9GAMM|nr:hypothetical protein [Thiohalocapsa halophila]MBK1630170.1 hypothetical protein [Thiohalocapsa halophila]
MSASAAEPVSLVWGGAFIRGASTEIQVRLDTASPQPTTVRVSSGPSEVSIAAPTNYPGPVVVPLHPGADGVVDVLLRDGAGSEHRHRLQLTPVAEPLNVDAAQGVLPRTASGYGPVAMLHMTRARLASLDAAEAAALAGYLAACGRMVVADAHGAVLEPLRAAAGCGGVFVAGAQAPDAPAHAPAALPSPSPDSARATDRLALWLLPYPLLLLALASLPGTHTPIAGLAPRRARLGPWLLAVPPAMAMVLWIGLPQTLPSARLDRTALMNVADSTYRWQGILTLSGSGAAVSLPPLSTPPIAVDGGRQQLSASADGTELRLPRPRQLLAERQYRLAGTASSPWQLEARLASGELHLGNLGRRNVPRGRLFIADPQHPGQRRAIPTPALAASESQSLPLPSVGRAGQPTAPSAAPAEAAADIPGASPPTALLPALLLPLPPTVGTDPRIETTGSIIVTLTGDAG